MAKVILIMSTGRCGTQFLAKLLAQGDDNTLVVHEGAGPNYRPATVFRGGDYDKVISETHQLRDEFTRIDQQLAAGQRFIDTGWLTYAWGPYFENRYGADFQFIHLLRNPFATAASMSTHGLLGDGEDRLNVDCIIRPFQPNVAFPEFQADYAEFSYFERGLYHWLEVHSFLKTQHISAAFQGLFRFEELFSNDNKGVQKLWKTCGFAPDKFKNIPAYDKYNVRARRQVSLTNEKLLEKVWALALGFGYDEELLKTWSDAEFLQARYSTPRLKRPPAG